MSTHIISELHNEVLRFNEISEQIGSERRILYRRPNKMQEALKFGKGFSVPYFSEDPDNVVDWSINDLREYNTSRIVTANANVEYQNQMAILEKARLHLTEEEITVLMRMGMPRA